MKKIENQEFVQWFDRDSAAVYSDLEFVKCRFESSGLSITLDPKLRSTVRNVRVTQCEQRGSAIDTAIIEDVVVEGFKTNGLFQTWGAVFSRVKLRGKVGRIMISPAVATGTARPEEQRAFDAANAEYYERVDWALDISEGEFEECELQRVPAHLVRRDPATQVVITREKAIQGKCVSLTCQRRTGKPRFEFMLNRGDADVVLVAGKRGRKFRELLDGLQKLRDAGVAEPD